MTACAGSSGLCGRRRQYCSCTQEAQLSGGLSWGSGCATGPWLPRAWLYSSRCGWRSVGWPLRVGGGVGFVTSMPVVVTVWAFLVVAVVVGCGQGSERDPAVAGSSVRASRSPELLSVGRPVRPRRVNVFAPGAIELRVGHPGTREGPGWFAMVLFPPPGRPRDVCVATGLVDEDPAEADTWCDVSVPGSATSFVELARIRGRSKQSPALISGVAPPEVRAVYLQGPGATRRLPLSAHRAFLAVYAPSARGRVRIVSKLRRGRAVRRFELPLSPRHSLPQHRHRRRGALFNDEIGKDVMLLSYRQLIRRYGPPAVLRRERGLRCAYYELVGFANDGWRFCFTREGRMDSAHGNTPPPPH